MTASRPPWTGQTGWHRAAWGRARLDRDRPLARQGSRSDGVRGADAVGPLVARLRHGWPTWPRAAVRWFTGLMVAGDVVKVGCFLHTGARVRSLARAVPIVMTTALAAAYAVALALA